MNCECKERIDNMGSEALVDELARVTMLTCSIVLDAKEYEEQMEYTIKVLKERLRNE